MYQGQLGRYVGRDPQSGPQQRIRNYYISYPFADEPLPITTTLNGCTNEEGECLSAGWDAALALLKKNKEQTELCLQPIADRCSCGAQDLVDCLIAALSAKTTLKCVVSLQEGADASNNSTCAAIKTYAQGLCKTGEPFEPFPDHVRSDPNAYNCKFCATDLDNEIRFSRPLNSGIDKKYCKFEDEKQKPTPDLISLIIHEAAHSCVGYHIQPPYGLSKDGSIVVDPCGRPDAYYVTHQLMTCLGYPGALDGTVPPRKYKYPAPIEYKTH